MAVGRYKEVMETAVCRMQGEMKSLKAERVRETRAGTRDFKEWLVLDQVLADGSGLESGLGEL